MATYYLKLAANGGNDSLAGTSPSTAWATWAKALGATGITGGDILYVAPGVYNITSTVTIGGTYSSTAQIIGDTTSAQFPGVNAGLVVLTGWNAAKTTYSLGFAAVISSSGKSNLTFKSINFDTAASTNNLVFTTCQNIAFEDCIFTNANSGNQATLVMSNTAGALNGSIKRCVFAGGFDGVYLIGNNVSDTTVVQSSLFTGFQNNTVQVTNCGAAFYNCTLINNRFSFYITGVTTSFPLRIYNCMMANAATGMFTAGAGLGVTEDYNRFCNVGGPRSGVTAGLNSTTNTPPDLEFFQVYKSGGNFPAFSANTQNNINKNFGTSTGAPATDLFGVAWTGTTPDAGAITYNPINLVAPTLVYNGGTDRNASVITIAPGSTSQSIELYLGATGLTASTAGLSAYYNRTRSADVQINLQARNITQAWTSGGFAEVNPNTMPGVYRLDIPNEALVAGADDVTVVVRGASGTNGAVMSIKLSSGGLTTAQTASAVWNALTNDHTTHGTFGWNVLRADQDSKEGLVTLHQSGGVSRVDADIHAVVNDTAAATAFKGALLHDGTGYVDSDVVRISTSVAAANELEGALLHNGTDYIDANLLSGNSTRVFVGRFQMTQTGTTQGDIIEAFTTDTPAFELQLFDGDNNLVPVTGATLGLRILDVTSTVVETGTPTIEYGTGGIVRWTAPGTYLSIGCPAGMYRMFVDRTVSGTTTTFGPLQIKVQVQ